MNVGERIKARRKQLGMSAERLAMLIGKSPATIYRYNKEMPFWAVLREAWHDFLLLYDVTAIHSVVRCLG